MAAVKAMFFELVDDYAFELEVLDPGIDAKEAKDLALELAAITWPFKKEVKSILEQMK